MADTTDIPMATATIHIPTTRILTRTIPTLSYYAPVNQLDLRFSGEQFDGRGLFKRSLRSGRRRCPEQRSGCTVQRFRSPATYALELRGRSGRNLSSGSFQLHHSFSGSRWGNSAACLGAERISGDASGSAECHSRVAQHATGRPPTANRFWSLQQSLTAGVAACEICGGRAALE